MDKKEWLRKVDRQFRITVPAALRKELGLMPGTRVIWDIRKNGAIMLMSRKEWLRHRRRRKLK